MAVTADPLLTGVFIHSLRRSCTGFKQTDSTIDVLVLYFINTGLITGLCNVLAFLFALILPYDLIYAAVGIVGTKLYATTLLAALNSRQSLAARGTLTFGLTQVEIFDIRPSIALSMVQRPAASFSNFERTPPPEYCLPQIPMEPNRLSMDNVIHIKPVSVEDTVRDHEGRDALDCVWPLSHMLTSPAGLLGTTSIPNSMYFQPRRRSVRAWPSGYQRNRACRRTSLLSRPDVSFHGARRVGA